MTLQFTTVKFSIYAILAIFLLTTLFAFTMYLPAPTAQAQFGVVFTPISDAIEKGGQILGKLWDDIQAAYRWARDLKLVDWEKARKALWDNVVFFLSGLVIKVAVNALSVYLHRLNQDGKIDNYMRYVDRVARYVYAMDAIASNPNYNPQDMRLLKILVLAGPAEIWGDVDQNRKFYAYVKQKVGTTEYCQTRNLSPRDPDYYAKLIRTKSPECTPAFVAAAAADTALNIVGQAQDAAQAELRNSGGYKGIRSCYRISNEDILAKKGVFEDEVIEATVRESGTTTRVATGEKIKTGEIDAVNVLPVGFALTCSALLQPTSYTHGLVDRITQVILEKSTTPGTPTTGQQVSSFLSSIFANALTNLMFCGKTGSIFASIDGHNANECTDFDFASQVPDIDANDFPLPDDVDTSGLLAGSDNKQLRDFWDDFCGKRLPLLFAYRNANYIKGDIYPIAIGILQDQKRIFFITSDFDENGAAGPQAYLETDKVQQFKENPSDPNQYGKLSIQKMLQNQMVPPQRNTTEREAPSYRGNQNLTYDYIWKLHDPLRVSSSDKSFDKELALSREYNMKKAGFPTAQDHEEVRNWIPVWEVFNQAPGAQVTSALVEWPFYADSSGKGFVWDVVTIDSKTNTTVAAFSPEGYTILIDRTIPGTPGSEVKLYSATSGGVAPNIADTWRYLVQTQSGELLLLTARDHFVFAVPNPDIVGGITFKDVYVDHKIWKLDKNVSVIAEEEGFSQFTNSLRLERGENVPFVEFVENNQTKVAGLTELDQQAPCGREPYGPPVDISSLHAKLEASRSISRPLWDWIQEGVFIRQSQLNFDF